MMTISSMLERFGEKGEKTGWTYIFISFEVAEKLNPGVRKAYRVKGRINQIAFKQVALWPMGEGNFILPVNADLLKKIKKPLGEKITVELSVDDAPVPIDPELLLCLEDIPEAKQKFQAMPASHQRYYSNHVTAAKTENTRAKRIAHIIESLLRGLSFAEMLRMK